MTGRQVGLAVLGLVMVVMAAVPFAVGLASAGGPKFRLVHFVQGDDAVLADGTRGIQVRGDRVAIVDPTELSSMARAAKAAALALVAMGPLGDSGGVVGELKLSPTRQSQYDAARCPRKLTLTEANQATKFLVDGSGGGQCKYGDPSCPDWMTYLPGPLPQCGYAATDCVRVMK